MNGTKNSFLNRQPDVFDFFADFIIGLNTGVFLGKSREKKLPETQPFKGIIYNVRKIKTLSAVIAPPYDVISHAMQEKLYRSSPYNVVRLILGKIRKNDDKNDSRYTRAKKFFSSWLKKRIMVEDNRESMYVYSQIYKTNSNIIERIGFIALMAIDMREGDNRVLAHENTLQAPKLDRLELMRAVRANLSPIFVLYDDKKHKILQILKSIASRNKPFIDIDFDNVKHRVWRLDDKRAIKRIEEIMVSKDIFIADGHHRYEVACTYAREIQRENVPDRLKQSSGYIMAYFVESESQILTILPAHRLIKDADALKNNDVIERLKKFFYIEKVSGPGPLISKLHGYVKSHRFGMYLGKGAFYILRLKTPRHSDRVIKDSSRQWKRLDVSILHFFIFQHLLKIRDDDDNIEFFNNPKDAASAVDNGKYRMAFFLNPTKVTQVKQIAKLGERMPRKATYFYPKPLSGLVVNKH